MNEIINQIIGIISSLEYGELTIKIRNGNIYLLEKKEQKKIGKEDK
jgi:hypothetical protein